MDIPAGVRKTGWMREPGSSRERLAKILRVAFAEGLLSEQTLSYRLGLLFGPRLIEPRDVVGDVTLRAHRPGLGLASLASAVASARLCLARISGRGPSEPVLLVLALDWSGAQDHLLIGRGSGCDIALDDATVSRRHARLVFRDGGWVVQDLASTNGVTVNGTQVGRCQLRPGDRLALGLQLIEVD